MLTLVMRWKLCALYIEFHSLLGSDSSYAIGSLEPVAGPIWHWTIHSKLGYEHWDSVHNAISVLVPLIIVDKYIFYGHIVNVSNKFGQIEVVLHHTALTTDQLLLVGFPLCRARESYGNLETSQDLTHKPRVRLVHVGYSFTLLSTKQDTQLHSTCR